MAGSGCLRCSVFFFSSRRRHTRFKCDWSSDVCSSDLKARGTPGEQTNLLQSRRTAMKTNWPALRHGYLILAGMALASSPVLAQTQAPAEATATSAVISSVAITQAPERSAVRVEGEGRLDVHAGRMQNPARLVLDFAGARLAVQKTVIPGISAPVRGVRIGQYRPDVARVVVDLTKATPYQVSRDGEAVVIYFENPSATPVQAVSRVTTLTSRHSSKDSKISAPRFGLPSGLTQPSVTLASFTGKKEPVPPDATTQHAAAQQAVQQ